MEQRQSDCPQVVLQHRWEQELENSFFLLESLGIPLIWRQTRRADIPKYLGEREGE